jgi:hypothetical protein
VIFRSKIVECTIYNSSCRMCSVSLLPTHGYFRSQTLNGLCVIFDTLWKCPFLSKNTKKSYFFDRKNKHEFEFVHIPGWLFTKFSQFVKKIWPFFGQKSLFFAIFRPGFGSCQQSRVCFTLLQRHLLASSVMPKYPIFPIPPKTLIFIVFMAKSWREYFYVLWWKCHKLHQKVPFFMIFD